MPEPTHNEVMEAVKALRGIVDSKLSDSGDSKERIDKINTFLDKQEELNQANLTQLKSAETKEAELKERLDALEIDLARRVDDQSVKNYRDAPEYKALLAYAKGEDLDADQKAILRTDIDPQGGYTVMGEMDNVITKKITEISSIRSVARVRTISGKSLEMPIRNGILTATYEGETAVSSESNSDYGTESLIPYRQTVTVPITRDLIMNSSFDMESEIFTDAAEAFAQGEGLQFISGNNVKRPEGILTNAAVIANARVSGTSGTLTADDMILLTGDLKTGYNPVYTLNRTTLAFLRTLKSTTGQFLWQPGMNGPVSNTMNGFDYVLSQDMPDIAGNALSVAFGDFMRGYTIVDRTGIDIVRDDLTRKKEAIVEFTINRYNYGKVTLPEAIKVLKIAP